MFAIKKAITLVAVIMAALMTSNPVRAQDEDLINDIRGIIVPLKNLPARWIGVECYPIMGLARAQLKLPDGQGLGVAKVVESSPAAKAGMKEFDLILKVNDQPMGEVMQIFELLADEKVESLKIAALRGGEPITFTVAPEMRPDFTTPEVSAKNIEEIDRILKERFGIFEKQRAKIEKSRPQPSVTQILPEQTWPWVPQPWVAEFTAVRKQLDEMQRDLREIKGVLSGKASPPNAEKPTAPAPNQVDGLEGHLR
jgi:membrane-associated protease RseP (regulator of RpoE activity)